MQKIKNTGVLKALVVFSFISAGLFLLFQYTNSNNERSEPLVTAKTENKTSVIASKTLKQDYNSLEESKTTVKKNRQKKPLIQQHQSSHYSAMQLRTWLMELPTQMQEQELQTMWMEILPQE